MAKIFINYRHQDTAHAAGRLRSELVLNGIALESIFMDDAIPPGEDFKEYLEARVAECQVLLAVIGPDWLEAKDEAGERRLDNPDDFVRIEIAGALRTGVRVVPILVDGAKPPLASRLPEELKALSRRHAVPVRADTFRADTDQLVKFLKGFPDGPQGAIAVEVGSQGRHQARYFRPGSGKTEWFSDHGVSPEMVVVPAGEFMMGSPDDEPERESWQKGTESPLHKITIRRPLAVGRFSISRGQFAAFVKATNYNVAPGAHVWNGEAWTWDAKASWCEPGFPQDASHPVVCVSWEDATAYTVWLAELTSKPYRLLSETEWEYAARAGTSGPFWWGRSISTSEANYNGNLCYAGGPIGEYRKSTLPVHSFTANPWGLYNVHGNVWEGCDDIWHDDYSGAPDDGSAWTVAGDGKLRVTRGAAWHNHPAQLRSAFRMAVSSDDRGFDRGFRIARTL